MENMDDARYAAEQEAQGSGDEFEIGVVSKMTGMKAPLLVYSGNVLGQVLEATAAVLQFDLACENFLFENARTRCCTFEQGTTIRQLELHSGDLLAIVPNPKGVA